MSAGYHTRAAAAAPALLRAAAAAPMDSDDEDYSPAASSDEGGLEQRQYSGSAAASSQLESPFMTRQREAHAHAHAHAHGHGTHPHILALQSQYQSTAASNAYAQAADALANRAMGGVADRRSSAASAAAAAAASTHPAVLAQLQARHARQEAASQMGPPLPALTLGPRPMALASAAGAAADGWAGASRRVRTIACCSACPAGVAAAVRFSCACSSQRSRKCRAASGREECWHAAGFASTLATMHPPCEECLTAAPSWFSR